MNLEELLRNRIIHRIRPDRKLAISALRRAWRDVDTAKTLIENEKFDWALAVSYNAMLQAGRALMFNQGYRPSSKEGHIAVVKFLQASFGTEVSDMIIIALNGMRKKRHRIVYEEMGIVSEGEADQALRWAEDFVKKADEMIQKETE